jgi:hypothetical protein
VTCRGCGCTDTNPCPTGCAWAEPGVCTNCVEFPRAFMPVRALCERCGETDCTSMGGLILCLATDAPPDDEEE